MIEYKSGDMLKEDAEALVNTVNCVGVMGRGIALQFKEAFPDNFKAYAKMCEKQEVELGRMFVFETGQLINPRYIINFPTKGHWREKSRVEHIETGLRELAAAIQQRNIHSVAIPSLACGLGGLHWCDITRRFQAALQPLAEVRVIVYEPQGASATRKTTHGYDARV